MGGINHDKSCGHFHHASGTARAGRPDGDFEREREREMIEMGLDLKMLGIFPMK